MTDKKKPDLPNAQTINEDGLMQYIHETPPGKCATIASRGGQMIVLRETWAEMAEVVEKWEGFIHVVAMVSRPGVHQFLAMVEHRLFPPGTPENDYYIQRMLYWPDKHMMWIIGSFPDDPVTMSHVMGFLETCGLRLADGTPMMLSGREEHFFPMQGPRVWTLENASPNHPVYENDPRVDKALRAREKEQIEAEQERSEDRREAGL